METESASGSDQERNMMIVSYLFWFFLGWAGVHRFYLGKKKSGLAQLILGFVWWLLIVVGIVQASHAAYSYGRSAFSSMSSGNVPAMAAPSVPTALIIGYVLLAVWGLWWLLDAYFIQKYVTEKRGVAGVAAKTTPVT